MKLDKWFWKAAAVPLNKTNKQKSPQKKWIFDTSLSRKRHKPKVKHTNLRYEVWQWPEAVQKPHISLLKPTKMNALEWPSQSLVLNPIKSLFLLTSRGNRNSILAWESNWLGFFTAQTVLFDNRKHLRATRTQQISKGANTSHNYYMTTGTVANGATKVTNKTFRQILESLKLLQLKYLLYYCFLHVFSVGANSSTVAVL